MKNHSKFTKTNIKKKKKTFGNPTNPQITVNYIMYLNNIFFNKKNAFNKIPTKHIAFNRITS